MTAQHSSTSKNVVTMSFAEQDVRIYTDKDGAPWWVLSECCAILGITDPSQAAERLDAQDRCKIRILANDGKHYASWCVNESGLYDLILDSYKPEAKKFRRWITTEVLPAIRRTGRYSITDRDIIAGFLAPSFLPWEKRFELEFYQEVCRVYSQPIPSDHGHSPMCAAFIARYIYDILPAPVRQEMDVLNPVINKAGDRRKRLHQLLKEDRVKDFLTKRINQIMAFLGTCADGDKEQFVTLITRHDQHIGITAKLTVGERLILSVTMPNEQLSLWGRTEEGAA